jgi:hypothetical protein
MSVNAVAVAAEIDSLNHKNIEPLPLSLRRAAEAYHVYVFSVAPHPIGPRAIGVGSFIVPGKEPGERVSKPLVFPATVYQTVCTENVNSYRWAASDGMDCAKDIVQLGKPADFTKVGLFISENEVPTEEEIAKAEQHRVDYLASLVNEADGYSAVNGGQSTININGQAMTKSNIAQIHRDALKELGWTRDWGMNKNVQMASCWNCGRSVLPTSVKCFHDGCGAPLKNEEAKQRFMNGDEEEPKRGPGRPRSVA